MRVTLITIVIALTTAGPADSADLRPGPVDMEERLGGSVAVQRYAEAIEQATHALELTQAEHGVGDIATVPFLNDLGRNYLLAGDAENSRLHYEQSLSIVRNNLGLFDTRAVKPYFGLGRALQRLGQHTEAIQSFQNAQHVTHRHAGVNNLDQLPIVEATSKSLVASGRWEDAENLQHFAYKIYRRNYGEGSVESLPGLYRLGEWYQQAFNFDEARKVYRRGLEIALANNNGRETTDLIPALRGIAATYLGENGPHRSKGLQALSRVVDIVDANADQFSLEQQIMAHIELADWAIHYSQEKLAWEHLESAWRLSRDEIKSGRDWPAFFDRPHLITMGPSLGMNSIGYDRVGEEVFYEFEFIIGRNGKPRYIEVLDTNLPVPTRQVAVGLMRGGRFRPRLVEGLAVETPNYRLRRVYPTSPRPDAQMTFRQPGFRGFDPID